MDKWTPAKEGSGFEFTEILQPLEKYRDRLVVVSNLAHRQAAGIGSDAGADHARSAAVFLSGAHPEKDDRPCWNHDRSDRGGKARSGYAAAVAGSRHRGERPELRGGLRMRVHQHNRLEDAHLAAAHGA